eukprot:7139858-Prymnesium_polylepis.1
MLDYRAGRLHTGGGGSSNRAPGGCSYRAGGQCLPGYDIARGRRSRESTAPTESWLLCESLRALLAIQPCSGHCGW